MSVSNPPNPLPKDNQIDVRAIIDSLRSKYIVDYERASGADSLSQLMSNDKHFTDNLLSALATAIGEATPITTASLPLDSWAVGYNQGVQEFVEALRGIGLDI